MRGIGSQWGSRHLLRKIFLQRTFWVVAKSISRKTLIVAKYIEWRKGAFLYIHNLKIYNLTKHIYINDIIGSMIGMATLNDL